MKLQVYVGDVYPLEGSHSADINQVRDIESFLIYHLRPQSASQESPTEIRNRHVLLINIGDIGELEKVMCHDENILSLLRQSLTGKSKSADKPKDKKTTHRKQSGYPKISMHLGSRD